MWHLLRPPQDAHQSLQNAMEHIRLDHFSPQFWRRPQARAAWAQRGRAAQHGARASYQGDPAPAVGQIQGKWLMFGWVNYSNILK